VQVALQRGQRCSVFGLQQPALEGLPGAVENVHGFFEEDLDDLIVHRRFMLQLRGGGTEFSDAQGAVTVTFDQAGGGRVQGSVQQFAQGLDPCRGQADFLPGGQLVKHVDQRFMGLFGLPEKPLADGQTALFHRAIEVEQGFAQFVDRVQVGDVCPFSQRGQFIQQRREFLALARVLLPTTQQAFGVEQDIHALGQEVGDQLRVTLDAQAGVGRVEQRCQLMVKQGLGAANQVGRAPDRHQRVAIQLA